MICWKNLVTAKISTRGMALLCQSLSSVLIACPILSFVFVLAKPCQPPFLGSMTSFCKGGVWSGSAISKFFRLPFALVDLWLGYSCSMGGGAFILMFLGVSITSFLEYLDVLGRFVLYLCMYTKNIESFKIRSIKKYLID